MHTLHAHSHFTCTRGGWSGPSLCVCVCVCARARQGRSPIHFCPSLPAVSVRKHSRQRQGVAALRAATIKDISAREILDSRGNPTIEVPSTRVSSIALAPCIRCQCSACTRRIPKGLTPPRASHSPSRPSLQGGTSRASLSPNLWREGGREGRRSECSHSPHLAAKDKRGEMKVVDTDRRVRDGAEGLGKGGERSCGCVDVWRFKVTRQSDF